MSIFPNEKNFQSYAEIIRLNDLALKRAIELFNNKEGTMKVEKSSDCSCGVKEVEVLDFPCLMENPNTKNIYFIVAKGKDFEYPRGYCGWEIESRTYSEDWTDKLVRYKGKITLSND